MRVLAITAHPDDMEFMCAGTLLKCKARGDEVFVCTINNGNMGHMVIMPDELRDIRRAEAQKSCDMAGFTYLPADIGDLCSYYQSKEQKDILVDIIRQADPDLLIIPDPEDYMCDHVAASKLAFDAAFMATCPHYFTKYPATDKITPIYYMATAAGINFNPTEYVDITEFYEKKLQMLHCHESQEIWLRDHDGVDYTKECRILSEYYGLQCHKDYAEAFRPCLVSHRIVTERMLP
ncbi:MAG: PIG-L family deacetylase [Clostridia bacterium]|nr:PIG-L family deacetylase [Clostridia bacterium]MBQ7897798.1 PIG-L family deacetylase [Clostridia bacterium]